MADNPRITDPTRPALRHSTDPSSDAAAVRPTAEFQSHLPVRALARRTSSGARRPRSSLDVVGSNSEEQDGAEPTGLAVIFERSLEPRRGGRTAVGPTFGSIVEVAHMPPAVTMNAERIESSNLATSSAGKRPVEARLSALPFEILTIIAGYLRERNPLRNEFRRKTYPVRDAFTSEDPFLAFVGSFPTGFGGEVALHLCETAFRHCTDLSRFGRILNGPEPGSDVPEPHITALRERPLLLRAGLIAAAAGTIQMKTATDVFLAFKAVLHHAREARSRLDSLPRGDLDVLQALALPLEALARRVEFFDEGSLGPNVPADIEAGVNALFEQVGVCDGRGMELLATLVASNFGEAQNRSVRERAFALVEGMVGREVVYQHAFEHLLSESEFQSLLDASAGSSEAPGPEPLGPSALGAVLVCAASHISVIDDVSATSRLDCLLRIATLAHNGPREHDVLQALAISVSWLDTGQDMSLATRKLADQATTLADVDETARILSTLIFVENEAEDLLLADVQYVVQLAQVLGDRIETAVRKKAIEWIDGVLNEDPDVQESHDAFARQLLDKALKSSGEFPERLVAAASLVRWMPEDELDLCEQLCLEAKQSPFEAEVLRVVLGTDLQADTEYGDWNIGHELARTEPIFDRIAEPAIAGTELETRLLPLLADRATTMLAYANTSDHAESTTRLDLVRERARGRAFEGQVIRAVVKSATRLFNGERLSFREETLQIGRTRVSKLVTELFEAARGKPFQADVMAAIVGCSSTDGFSSAEQADVSWPTFERVAEAVHGDPAEGLVLRSFLNGAFADRAAPGKLQAIRQVLDRANGDVDLLTMLVSKVAESVGQEDYLEVIGNILRALPVGQPTGGLHEAAVQQFSPPDVKSPTLRRAGILMVLDEARNRPGEVRVFGALAGPTLRNLTAKVLRRSHASTSGTQNKAIRAAWLRQSARKGADEVRSLVVAALERADALPAESDRARAVLALGHALTRLPPSMATDESMAALKSRVELMPQAIVRAFRDELYDENDEYEKV